MKPMPSNNNTIYCGELCLKNFTKKEKTYNLSFYDTESMQANVKIRFDKFITDISGLSPRLIDLLEIASYIFAADRMVFRGKRDSVHNRAWSRSFVFNIPVRDFDFWNLKKTLFRDYSGKE